MLSLKVKRSQRQQFLAAARVVAEAQGQHPEGRKYYVYGDFYGEQGDFHFVFPHGSAAELEKAPGHTFRVTRLALGQKGELAAHQFEQALQAARASIFRFHPGISNGRGGSKRKPSPYLYYTKLRTRPDFDWVGVGKRVQAAEKKQRQFKIGFRNLTGSYHTLHYFSRLDSLAELDDRGSSQLRETLRSAYGREEGDELLLAYRGGLIDSENSLLRYVPELGTIGS